MDDFRFNSPNRWHRIAALSRAMSAGNGGTLPEGSSWKLPAIEELQKTGLASAVESFSMNSDRLKAVSRFPIELFNHGRRMHHFDCRVMLRVTGNIEPIADTDPRARQTEVDLEDVFRRWVNGELQSPQVDGRTDYTHVAAIIATEPKRVVPAATGFGWAALINAWTMFESLAEDLWVAAVNARPIHLARLVGNRRSAFKEMPPQLAKLETKGTVSISSLVEYAFEVRNHMGQILVDQGRVGFRRLPNIRDAYHAAFHMHADRIDRVLDDPRLQYAAAVRNVQVHKAGKVDREFLRQVATVPNVPPLNDGDEFPLSGRIIAELCDAAVWCSAELICAVHSWLLAHP